MTLPSTPPTITQEFLDRFYWSNGPCCAGCDWWHHISSFVGSCTKAAIVPGRERMDAIGISWSSHRFKSGHPITQRDYKCGQFKDEFDWTSLPLPYRKRIGAPVAALTICPNCNDANKYGDYEGPTCQTCLGDGFITPSSHARNNGQGPDPIEGRKS